MADNRIPLPEDAFDFLSRIGLAPVERGMRSLTTNWYDLLAELSPDLQAKADKERVLQAMKSAENPPSPQVQAAQQKLSQLPPAKTVEEFVQGLGPALEVYKTTPELLLSQIGESAPFSVPAILATLVTKSPAVGAAVMGGTSGTSKYFENVYGRMLEQGLSPLKPEDIQKAKSDPAFQKWAQEKGIPSAAFVGALDAASFMFGGRGTGTGHVLREALVEQPVLGGAGEAGAQVIAKGEVKPGEVIAEMAAEPVTSIPEIATNVAVRKAKAAPEAKVEEVIAEEAPKTQSVEDIEVLEDIVKETPSVDEVQPLEEVQSVETATSPLEAASEVDILVPPITVEHKGTTFETAKGSVYHVNEDGTTTRNKAFRPEHGEAEQGIQPKSETTFYLKPEEANKLSIMQSKGGFKTEVAPLADGQWGVRFAEGPEQGKFIKDTVVKPEQEPKVGLLPVELWDNGSRIHFGNDIVKVASVLDNAENNEANHRTDTEQPQAATPTDATLTAEENVRAKQSRVNQPKVSSPISEQNTDERSQRSEQAPISSRFRGNVRRFLGSDVATTPQSVRDINTEGAVQELEGFMRQDPSMQSLLATPGFSDVNGKDMVDALLMKTALHLTGNTLKTQPGEQIFAVYDFLKSGSLTEEDLQVLAGAAVENAEAVAKVANLQVDDVKPFDDLSIEEFLFERFLRRPDLRGKIPEKTKAIFEKLEKTLEDMGNTLRDKAKVKTYDDLFENEDAVLSEDALQEVLDKRHQVRLAQIAEGLGQSYLEHDLAAIGGMDPPSGFKILSAERPDFTSNVENVGKFNRLWRTWHSLAEKGPILSRVYNLIRDREQDTAVIAKVFNTRLRKIVGDTEESRKNFNEANEHLNRLISTGQPLRFDNLGRIQYTYKGQKIAVSPEMSTLVRSVNNFFKAFLDPEIDVLKQRIASMFHMKPADVSVAKLVELKEQRPMSPAREDILQMYIDTLAKAEAFKDPTVPYIPRSRYGDIGIAVHAPGDKTKLLGFWTIEPSWRGNVTKQMIAAKKEDIKNELKADGVTDYEMGDAFLLTYDNIDREVGRDFASLDLLMELVNAETKKRGQELAEGSDDLVSAVRERVFTSSITRRLKERKNIRGYSKDYLRNANAYVQAQARNIPNMKWAEAESNLRAFLQKETFKDKDGVPQPWVNDIAMKQLDYLASPFGDATQLRSINFLWTMAGNVSSAVLQLPTVGINLPAFLSMIDSNVIGLEADAVTKLGRVASDLETWRTKRIDEGLFDHWFEKGLIRSSEQLQLMKDIWRNGYLQTSIGQEFVDDLRTEVTMGDKAKGGLASVIEASGALMQTTESWSRLVSALMLTERLVNSKYQRRMIKAYGDNPLFSDMVKTRGIEQVPQILTELGIDEIHGRYTKANRGALNRGWVPQIVTPMATYTQTLYQLLERLALKRGWAGRRAFLFLAAGLMIAGGLGGMPGWDALELIYKTAQKFNGRNADLEKDIREGLVDQGWPPEMVNMVYNGALGESMANRLGVQTPGLGILEAALDPEAKITQPLGIAGSILAGMQTAAQKMLMGGTWEETVQEVSPASLRNILKAEQGMERGFNTKTGNRLVNPEELTAGDYWGQMAGFTPDLVTRRRKQRYWQTLNETEGQPSKSGAVERVARIREDMRGLAADDPAREAMRQQIMDVKKDLREFNRKNKIPMTPDYWEGFNRSVQTRVMQRRKPGKPQDNKERSKAARKSRETLGLQ